MKHVVEEYKFKDLTNNELYEYGDEFTITERLKMLEENGRTFVKHNIELRDKFLDDVKNGVIKNPKNFNSVNAWRKKNGLNSVNHSYGSSYDEAIRLRYVDSWGMPSVYFCLCTPQDRTWDYISAEFTRMLFEFRSEEKKHFNEHDEYTVLSNKVNEALDTRYNIKSNIFADFRITTGSGVHVVKYDKETDSIDWNTKRDLTIDEMKAILKFKEDFDRATTDYFKAYFPIKHF